MKCPSCQTELQFVDIVHNEKIYRCPKCGYKKLK